MSKMWEQKEVLYEYTKAFVHAVYRNGPVENVHVRNITDSEMKQFNKYMMNRFGYLFSYLLFGNGKTEREINEVVDTILEFYWYGISKEERPYILKFDKMDEAVQLALGMFYFQEKNSPLVSMLSEGRLTEKHMKDINMYMIKKMILVTEGHVFKRESAEIKEIDIEFNFTYQYRYGHDWDDIEPIDVPCI